MDKQIDIEKIFLKLSVDLQREPTFEELKNEGVLRKDIRREYVNKTSLRDKVWAENNVVFSSEEVSEKISTNGETRDYITKIYYDILVKQKRFPVYSDFLVYGISSSTIKNVFGGMEKLKEFMLGDKKDDIKLHFATVEDIFRNTTKTESQYPKRIFVTTAVGDSKANVKFLAAVDNYCARKNAQIYVMPCESVSNSFENKTALFDPIFNDEKYNFVSDDIQLNNNIRLCSIQVSAKQIKTTTGLSRIGIKYGSHVLASPKQFLDIKPLGNKKGQNYAIMTTGACTDKSYFSNVFVSKRLSYIADHDHIIGGLIIELEDENTFHYRQIQADNEGNFVDLGIEYRNDGSIVEGIETNVVLGDIHAANMDDDAIDTFIENFKNMTIKNVFLHDVFDGNSVNHHIKTISEKSKRVLSGKSSLVNELIDTFHAIKYIQQDLGAEQIYIVKSNHDEFLTRYLAEGRYIEDPENHYTSLKIAVALFENKDTLEKGFEVVGATTEDLENIIFLSRESSVKIADIQLASHGDLGLNGAKSSLNGIEEVYGNCVIGHAHSAAIQRGVFRVGTMSKLDLGYNVGPCSWTQTNCLVYANGQRQLVNFVNNKYYMK